MADILPFRRAMRVDYAMPLLEASAQDRSSPTPEPRFYRSDNLRAISHDNARALSSDFFGPAHYGPSYRVAATRPNLYDDLAARDFAERRAAVRVHRGATTFAACVGLALFIVGCIAVIGI
jgi:hypothetical protein